MVLFTALLISIVLWVFVITYHLLTRHALKLFHFSFSEKNYHLLMLGVPAGVMVTSWYQHTAQPIAIFLFFAIAGVFGETLFSMWWHSFFGQRFWVYTTETLYHSYTSVLNFIPWGAAGLLAMEFARVIVGAPLLTKVFTNGNTYATIALVYFGSLALQFSIFYSIRAFTHSEFKFHEVTVSNYFFFVFPLLAVLVYFGLQFSYTFFFLALVFGCFFPFMEYFFGKGVQLFITKKLWSYTYITFDNEHFSPLSVVPFMIAGFWFLIVYGFFEKFLFSV